MDVIEARRGYVRIELPDDLEVFVETQAKRCGYLSPQDFVIDLVRREEAEAETRDRTRVEELLATLTDIQWNILRARFEAADPLLTSDEREALFIYEGRRELLARDPIEHESCRFPPLSD